MYISIIGHLCSNNMDLRRGGGVMERYDRYGNIQKLNVMFESRYKDTPERSRDAPQKPRDTTKRSRDTPERSDPTFNSCEDCTDDTCFYGRYRQYCSDNFIGKCNKAKQADERQRMLKIIFE
jgi:hypothetical protein